MGKRIILTIGLVCLLAAKPKKGEDGYYYHSPFLTEEVRNDPNALLRFEEIASGIQDTLELIQFYQAVSEHLFLKSQDLDSDYQDALENYQLLIRFYEEQYGYRPEYFVENINSPENLNAVLNAGYVKFRPKYWFQPLKITDNSIDKNLHWYQLQVMRSQFIDQYKWVKENLRRRQDYIQFMKDNPENKNYYDPKFFSKYLSYEQFQSIEYLLRFDEIAREIKNQKERAIFYRAAAEALYLKTLELNDKFTELYEDYTDIIQEMEMDFGYATRTVIYDEFEKSLKFSPVRISNTAIDKRLHYYQALIMRDQYIKLHRWAQIHVKDRKNYLAELNTTGPPVIYYVDDNPYITDYKFPTEISKYLTASARNNIDSLLKFQDVANTIHDPPERAKFYSAVSEALTVKTHGLELEFNYIVSKFKNMILYYEQKMEYGHFNLDATPPINFKAYRPIAVTDTLLSSNLHLKQAKLMVNQYAVLHQFYDSKLEKFRHAAVHLKADYDNRRHDLSFPESAIGVEQYEFTSPFLTENMRNEIHTLLKAEETGDQITDTLDQAIFYRAVAEAINLHLQALDKKYVNTTTTYLNLMDNYEYNLGFDGSFNFSGIKPWSEIQFEPIRIQDYSLNHQLHYKQMGILRQQYIQLHEFYQQRYADYKIYLRILKSDEARLKIAEEQTNLNPGDLYFKEIFSSPYFTNKMRDSEDELLKYLFVGEDIKNQLEEAEFYRTVSEAFYWGIKNKINQFMTDQRIYRKTIKELENNLGETPGKVKGRRPRFEESFRQIRVLQGTIQMNLHEKHARMLEKQYNKMMKKLDKYYTDYTEYIGLLEDRISERDVLLAQQSAADQLNKMTALSIQEKLSVARTHTIKYFEDELSFLQDIPLDEIENTHYGYIKAEWDIFSNISEMTWFDRKGRELKSREFIYNEQKEISRTIDKSNGRTTTITWYQTGELGELFFDFAYHIGLSKTTTNYYKEIQFNDSELIEAVQLHAISGNTLGIIDYGYSTDGTVTEVVWYLGDRKEKIREVSRIPREIQEVSESNDS